MCRKCFVNIFCKDKGLNYSLPAITRDICTVAMSTISKTILQRKKIKLQAINNEKCSLENAIQL